MGVTQERQHSLAYRLLIAVGGLAMLAAVTVEVLAVAGRMGGLPLPGSIELVQVLVVVSGMLGIVVATLNRSHATVRLLLDRLPRARAGALRRVTIGLAALFFLLLAIGSFWLLLDLWPGHEESEIWGVSYRPLRILVAAGSLFVTGLFAWRCLRGGA